MSKNKLMIEMTIFASLLFILCSLIVINDKKIIFLSPKINQKLTTYLKKHHQDILKEVEVKKTIYHKKNSTFTMRIENKKNKNLYFIIQYKNKKITSTYQKDYLEGETLLNHLKRKIEKNLNTNKNTKVEIQFTKKLNQYNSYLYESLLLEKEIENLEIYYLKITTLVKDLKKESIIFSINEWYSNLSRKINPKYYHFKLINQSNITQELKIKWLNSNIITNHLEEVISKIINQDHSIKEKWSIEFEYTN